MQNLLLDAVNYVLSKRSLPSTDQEKFFWELIQEA